MIVMQKYNKQFNSYKDVALFDSEKLFFSLFKSLIIVIIHIFIRRGFPWTKLETISNQSL